ncbi:MAG: peroxiredoxin [Candidatus Pelagibacter sp. TMED253]|nr:MAG: peroxiredoxin [Candidatus Pelagibacter sp. TMED253]
MYEEFEKNNIKVIGISYNNSEALKKFKERYSLPFSFLSDKKKEVAKSFGANGLFTPKRMTFVINKIGKIEKIYKKVNINTHAETILKDLTN